jgi:hypothetical protein
MKPAAYAKCCPRELAVYAERDFFHTNVGS